MEKRFVSSKRHTIEVDFHPYLREIRRERKRASSRLDDARSAPPGGQVRGGRAPRRPVEPRRGPRGSRGRGRRLKPPSGLRRSRLFACGWLAHQTSHSAPKTGILSTTTRKKIGQNPVIWKV